MFFTTRTFSHKNVKCYRSFSDNSSLNQHREPYARPHLVVKTTRLTPLSSKRNVYFTTRTISHENVKCYRSFSDISSPSQQKEMYARPRLVVHNNNINSFIIDKKCVLYNENDFLSTALSSQPRRQRFVYKYFTPSPFHF